jgi:ketosteroid isomerase-like protein
MTTSDFAPGAARRSRHTVGLTAALALLALAVASSPARATATDGDRAGAARAALGAYAAAIRDAGAVDAFLEMLIADSPTANVEVTWAGAPGRVLPYAGTFVGREGVRSALQAIRDTSTTERFDVTEVLDTSYAVDFTKGAGANCAVGDQISDCTFLIPQTDRVAARIAEEHGVKATSRRYRLDSVALLTLGADGKVSDLHFFYDSYVPSEAYVGVRDQIVNPDIAPVLDPRREQAPSRDATLAAVLRFFVTFANPAVSVAGDFTPLEQVITDDVVISFAGDPRILPFSDDQIRQGKQEVLRTFDEQLTSSHPRTFDIHEFFVGGRQDDRVIANTFERRFSTETNRGYEVFVEINMTAKQGKVGSIQGNFDSVITATAFTGTDPFTCDLPAPARRGAACDRRSGAVAANDRRGGSR